MTDKPLWTDTADGRRASRLSGHRAARREQIIKAAALAIETNGPDAGTAQIAELAGVARPHVYRHFTSKEELETEVARYAAGELKARVRPTLRKTGPVLEIIRGPVTESVDWAAENPNLYRFITQRTETRDLRRTRLGRTHFLSEIVDAASEYMAASDIPADPPDGILAGLMGMVDASIIWWLDHQDEPREQMVDRLTRQIHLILVSMLGDIGVEVPDELHLP